VGYGAVPPWRNGCAAARGEYDYHAKGLVWPGMGRCRTSPAFGFLKGRGVALLISISIRSSCQPAASWWSPRVSTS